MVSTHSSGILVQKLGRLEIGSLLNRARQKRLVIVSMINLNGQSIYANGL